MSQERLNRVLVGPIVSEKSTMLADKNNQIAFRVVKDATKKEVKDAVELLFKVQVESVQVINLKGKQKRFGRFEVVAPTSARLMCASSLVRTLTSRRR